MRSIGRETGRGQALVSSGRAPRPSSNLAGRDSEPRSGFESNQSRPASVCLVASSQRSGHSLLGGVPRTTLRPSSS
jgi:hypothetical protein